MRRRRRSDRALGKRPLASLRAVRFRSSWRTLTVGSSVRGREKQKDECHIFLYPKTPDAALQTAQYYSTISLLLLQFSRPSHTFALIHHAKEHNKQILRIEWLLRRNYSSIHVIPAPCADKMVDETTVSTAHAPHVRAGTLAGLPFFRR